MLYHGSPVSNIKVLEPHISNHGKPLVYLTAKREIAMVYLSNAVEKYHRDHSIAHTGRFYTWASYGFNREGILVLDEYYPHATEETYAGAAGYLYSVQPGKHCVAQQDIPFAFTCHLPVPVSKVEFVPDAYKALLSLEQEGKIQIRRYGTHSAQMLEWIEKVITEDFAQNKERPDYIRFLQAKFPFL